MSEVLRPTRWVKFTCSTQTGWVDGKGAVAGGREEGNGGGRGGKGGGERRTIEGQLEMIKRESAF